MSLLNKVNFDDEALRKGLVKILESGSFEVKGSEVELFARILIWVKVDLEKIIKEDKPKMRANPIQKMGN